VLFEPVAVCGVDFSGARLAGRTTWVAGLAAGARGRPALRSLGRLDEVCGSAERAAALVEMIRRSDGALWAMDFPFGLPVEVMGEEARWPDQFRFLAEWGEDGYGAGEECLRRGEALGGPRHVRRKTDLEEQAPFDPYHYRIMWLVSRWAFSFLVSSRS
jgi:hypothetical protein